MATTPTGRELLARAERGDGIAVEWDRDGIRIVEGAR